MPQTAPPPVPALPSLTERKRLLVRRRIIEAADELFTARGFEDVSVSDIALRADVGRTTFFRYFVDKTEVVFAKEQAMLDAIALAGNDGTAGAASTCADAVEQLRSIVLDLCQQATADSAAYQRHSDLIARHLELRARDALKTQQIAISLSEVLRARGTDEAVAVLAAQIALACYYTGRQRATSAAGLSDETRAAFDEALSLGHGRNPRGQLQNP